MFNYIKCIRERTFDYLALLSQPKFDTEEEDEDYEYNLPYISRNIDEADDNSCEVESLSYHLATTRKFQYRGIWGKIQQSINGRRSSRRIRNDHNVLFQENNNIITEGEDDDPIMEHDGRMNNNNDNAEVEEEEVGDLVEDENDSDFEDDFQSQLTDIYPVRFATMKGQLYKNIKDNWSDEIPIVPIREARNYTFEFFDYDSWIKNEVLTETYLSSDDCQTIVLVGILKCFKPSSEAYTTNQFQKLRMTYLPSMKPTKEAYGTIQLVDETCDDGVLLLVQLNSESNLLNLNRIVNGIPCAVQGFSVMGSGFVVSDVIYATPEPCLWPKIPQNMDIEMVFISGLLFGDGLQENSIELDLLSDYLLGLCGCPDEQDFYIKPKTRVFFLGNSFLRLPNHVEEPSEGEIKKLVSAGNALDSFFSKLSKTMQVIIIPGETDPTEQMLPQKPFHPSFFPLSQENSNLCKNFHNPCRVKIKTSEATTNSSSNADVSLDIILSSGSNVNNVKKFLPDESTIVIASRMLEWGHLNPADRDFSYFNLEDGERCPEDDILAIRQSLPHLCIIGNQKQFEVGEFKGTKIVGVPSFHSTHQIIGLVQSSIDDSFMVLPMNFGTVT